MIRHITIPAAIALVLLAGACNQKKGHRSSENTSADAATDGNSSSQQFCFLKVEGQQSIDSTQVTLLLRGDTVEGKMNWVPAEKDARRGTIKGTRKGNIITGVWSFIQEGSHDSLPLQFKLNGDTLLQKEFAVDPATGRQIIKADAAYKDKLLRVDCRL
ncbi:hypothetical protein [Arcticibacter sp. MXS-1]|uniref:hypothetical protein n=1 Tax=Arcticibacter sp. MXS-1 TaxID=3341726 RepID=UPI0035A941D3